jgi:hypothetical protein
MVLINGQRSINRPVNIGAHQVPPSSMLATHFAPVHGNGGVDVLPDFDKNSFDLLLEESLGQDEHGESNLTTDVGTNHKLISVLFKAGIDRAVGQSENPFNAYPTGRDALQILLCLDVMKLALERSPRVLFLPTSLAEAGPREEIPLYAWLTPRLLQLLATCAKETETLDEKVQGVLAAVLRAGNLCSKATSPCSTISTFFHNSSEALLQNVASCGASSPMQRSGYLSNGSEAYSRALSKLHIESNPEFADTSIQIPGALLAALTVTACSVEALVDASQGATTSRMRIASQVLDHLERIWQILVEGLEEAETGIYSLFIDFFATMGRLRCATSEASLITCRRRLNLLWAGSFSDCMDAIYSLTEGDSREPLENVLTSTLHAATTDTTYCETLSEILDSRLQTVRDEGQLDSELQVSENLIGGERCLTLVQGTCLRYHRSHTETAEANPQYSSRQRASIRQRRPPGWRQSSETTQAIN